MDKFVDSVLKLPEYGWWFDAIIRDDKDIVDKTLDEKTSCNKYLLLNGRFIHDNQDAGNTLLSNKDVSENERKYVKDYDITYPWCLAGAHGSKHVIDAFIKFGVNILQNDNQGNVIHCMILRAYLKPEKEEFMIETYDYLAKHLNTNQMKDLLYAENDMGLRPVEYAAHLGVFDLLLAMYNTKDIYLAYEYSLGVFVRKWYDVTEYESFDENEKERHYKSPLIYITLLDKEHLKRLNTE